MGQCKDCKSYRPVRVSDHKCTRYRVTPKGQLITASRLEFNLFNPPPDFGCAHWKKRLTGPFARSSTYSLLGHTVADLMALEGERGSTIILKAVTVNVIELLIKNLNAFWRSKHPLDFDFPEKLDRARICAEACEQVIKERELSEIDRLRVMNGTWTGEEKE